MRADDKDDNADSTVFVATDTIGVNEDDQKSTKEVLELLFGLTVINLSDYFERTRCATLIWKVGTKQSGTDMRLRHC